MKKLFVILILLSGSAGSSFAQLFGTGIFSSSNQQLVEKAVQDGIVLLRQEYQLEDTLTMKRYTWDNRPEFGSAVSMCVLAENGYVVADRVLHPWESDSRFSQYRNTKYRPVLSKTYFRTVADSVYRAAGRPEPRFERNLSDDGGWVYAVDSLFGGKGFAADRASGEKDGWLVWLTADKDSEDDTAGLSLVTYRHKLTVEESSERCEIPASTTLRSVIGGIYVVPQYRGIGEVVFALTGVVVPDGDRWQLLRIADSLSDDSCAVEESEPTPSDDLQDALTPVQQDDDSAETDGDGQNRKTKKQKK